MTGALHSPLCNPHLSLRSRKRPPHFAEPLSGCDFSQQAGLQVLSKMRLSLQVRAMEVCTLRHPSATLTWIKRTVVFITVYLGNLGPLWVACLFGGGSAQLFALVCGILGLKFEAPSCALIFRGTRCIGNIRSLKSVSVGSSRGL